MSELTSVELFNQFRSSNWPQQFSAMAQSASSEGVAVDELGSFPAYESSLIIAPEEDRQMLEAMGIIEDNLFQKGVVTPSMVKDGFSGDPNAYVPHFSEFGKQVIMTYENLLTPEEHSAANEAAQLELERLLAEAEAELGVQ